MDETTPMAPDMGAPASDPMAMPAESMPETMPAEAAPEAPAEGEAAA